jgi:hypothetical protein
MANFLSRVAQCLVSHASALPLPIPNARYCIFNLKTNAVRS